MKTMNKNDQKFHNLIPDTNWLESIDNEFELLTGLLLDTLTPLERLKEVIKTLKEWDKLDYRHMSLHYKPTIAGILKLAGYTWYNAKSKYFRQDIKFDLKTATFEQMLSINGVGPKLASLWMRIMHGTEIPILDTHVKRWLKNKGYDSNNYAKLSEAFTLEAKKLNLSVSELDRQVVGDGIKKRRGIT